MANKAKQSNFSIMSLAEIVSSAWKEGQQIDLSGIGYGRIHWGNRQDINNTPRPYYFFLAGLCVHFKLTRVLEIGTHCGGATRAMWKGISLHNTPNIITVDITSESDPYLKAYHGIKKIQGDANSEEVYHQIGNAFEWNPIDLVYIDAEHKAFPTLVSDSFYKTCFRPKLIILDDITLNNEMQKAWHIIISSVQQENALNAAELYPAIRPSPDRPGFGVIRPYHGEFQ